MWATVGLPVHRAANRKHSPEYLAGTDMVRLMVRLGLLNSTRVMLKFVLQITCVCVICTILYLRWRETIFSCKMLMCLFFIYDSNWRRQRMKCVTKTGESLNSIKWFFV